MGDIVSGISLFFSRGFKSNCHIIFHYPPNFNYETTIPSILNAFDHRIMDYKYTYSIDTSWSSVSDDRALAKFGAETKHKPTCDHNEVWWFSGDYAAHRYFPFKQKWKGNLNGPIALALNHKDFNIKHPIVNKFFEQRTNEKLAKLVDNKNFFLLGEHQSFEQNLNIISDCRYVVGIEGGWTHVTHAMRAPFIVATNFRDAKIPRGVHPSHPLLKVIETKDIDPFVSLKSNISINRDTGITLLEHETSK